MLETITSIKDEKIALARAIKSRKGRQEHQRILLEVKKFLIGQSQMLFASNIFS